MGYQHYFYLVENETLDKIHNFSKDEFYKWGSENNLIEDEVEDGLNLPLYGIGTEFFELGRDYDNANEVQANGKPLFKDKELFNKYKHYEPYIVGKEALLNVIEFQKSTIIKFYEYMLFRTDEERLEKNFDDQTKEEVYKQHIESMYSEWKNRFNKVFAINLDETNPAITTSWKYEYCIFELVRLYKATDWEKYSLIFMVW